MNENEIDIENELKHWGILGMKWGIRNYQNPDGSLTPLGRIRYGVSAKKDITGNVMGVNDAGSLSSEELKRMTKRYQEQADYYQARNNYIYQEKRYKENTAPSQKEHRPSAIGRFMNNVFVQPLESVLSKNANFIYGMIGYKMLEGTHPEAAELYFNTVVGSNYHRDNSEEKSKKNANTAKNNKNAYLDRKKLIDDRNNMLAKIEKAATDQNVNMDEYQNLIGKYEELFNEVYDPTKYAY